MQIIFKIMLKIVGSVYFGVWCFIAKKYNRELNNIYFDNCALIVK